MPQHFTAPPPVSAQVCQAPAEIAVTPAVNPTTSTAVSAVVVVPFPSSPDELAPQHFTAPPPVSAQV